MDTQTFILVCNIACLDRCNLNCTNGKVPNAHRGSTALTRTAVHANLQVTDDSSFSVFRSKGMQSTRENVFPEQSKPQMPACELELGNDTQRATLRNWPLPVRARTEPSQSPTWKRDLLRMEQMRVPQRMAVAPRTCGSP